MGAWGAGVFSDDDAADVRDRYRELLGDGKSGEQATNILLEEWSSELDNTVLWLALAATQWRCGHLEDRIKARALQIIVDETDLERWKEAGDAAQLSKRRAVLERLRKQLLSNPPPEINIKKRYRSTTDWQPGELIAYKLLSGSTVLFRVIGVEGDKGGTWPVCEVLDWTGYSIPDEAELKQLPIRHCVEVHGKPQLGIGRASAKEYPEHRITRLNLKLRPSQQLAFPRTFTLWRHLDAALADCFGLH